MPHPERMPYPRKFCAFVFAEWIARRNTKPESAEPSGPQAIADRNRFAIARHLVARAKHPPDVRGSAEHGKIVGADRRYLETLRMLRTRQIFAA